MRDTWLILDVHYLCHRAFHSFQGLQHGGSATGVIFGFLKSITTLKDEFQTDKVAFCFEHPHLFRRDLYPLYKAARRRPDRTEQEKKDYQELTIQICELRKRYLPQIGFKNIFCSHGCESDDLMASIARDAEDVDEIILVTADQDMFQCLRSNVSMYSPQKQKLYTRQWFKKTYGIPPWKWAQVKAIAGCPGDSVPGVKGVGEVTALKFLKALLPPTSAAYKKILSEEGIEITKRNEALVALPCAGAPQLKLRDDEINLRGWREVCKVLGMRTLAGHPPIATMRRVRG